MKVLHGLFFGGLVSFFASASSVHTIELIPRGSVTPPGDVIRLSVFLKAGESNVSLLVRALEIQGESQEIVKAIPSRDSAKPLTVSSFIHRDDASEPTLVDKRIVIPYEEFGYPETLIAETRKIAYEVTGTREVDGEGVIDFIAPTRIAELTLKTGWRNIVAKTRHWLSRSLRRDRLVGFKLNYNKETGAVTRVPVNVDVEMKQERMAPALAPKGFTRSEHLGDEGSLSPVRTAHPVIYFATNRNLIEGKKLDARFGNNLEDTDTLGFPVLTYGDVRVSIPVKVHQEGVVEQGSWWSSKSQEGKHFLFDAMSTLPKTDFVKGIDRDDLIIFIHGYNTDFKKAILQSAQLHYDLNFPGNMIAFAWPSVGSAAPAAYLRDARMAEQSVNALATLIRVILRRIPNRKIHVLAHSMGNEILLPALRRLELEDRELAKTNPEIPPLLPKRFSNIIIAAPDVQRTHFDSLIPTVTRASKRVSYYYSKWDLALEASSLLNGVERAGQAPYFFEGMDTINAANVSSFGRAFGHTYFNAAPEAIKDLFLSINLDLGPDKRSPPLGAPQELVGFEGFKHYYFLP
jgi:esterase/lipase superfamily enzyme